MSKELSLYKKDGFYVAKGLLKISACDFVRSRISATFASVLKDEFLLTEKDLHLSMTKLYAESIDKYKKVAGSVWRLLDVNKLLQSDEIINFLIDKFKWGGVFIPGGQVVHIMANDLRIPDGYFGLSPHQDWPSVQGSLDGLVVWIPLVDVDRNNFPLEVVPGSHINGLMNTHGTGNEIRQLEMSKCNEMEWVPVEVSVGDVVFMSNFTVHRSSTFGVPGCYRVAVSTRYDNASEKTYIERCYPTAYQRTVHRDLFIHGFPSRSNIDEIF